MKRKTLLVMMMILLPAVMCAQHATLKQQMEKLRKEKEVNFVYDSSLEQLLVQQKAVDQTRGSNLRETLQMLFKDTGIEWQLKGRYVTLRRQKREAPTYGQQQQAASVQQRHTLSGYVRDENGESLINATVMAHGAGATTTNSYGFFSMTLPAGHYDVEASYVGFDNRHQQVKLDRDRHITIQLKENNMLGEVVVTGDLNSRVLTTQTGKKTLTHDDLNTEFALLSSPDLIKTLQRSSGVSEGIDVTSGLYVHGGNDDENLYLLDGTSMYTVNHALGLFSAFNTEVVKNVDFYKSGFPARYGGRLSSVTDVRTNDGDMLNYHGSYSIGLIDGRFQMEGPVKTNRERQLVESGKMAHYSTSFNFGIRRSWLDVITEPVFYFVNKKADERIKIHYFLHDINGKITHVFNDRSRAYFSIYSSKDMMKNTYYWDDTEYTTEGYHDIEDDENHLSWGNLNMALNWNYQLKPNLFANFSAVYTHNRSIYEYFSDWRYGTKGAMNVDHIERKYRSTIYDGTLRADFDFRPNTKNHIRFGGDMTWHEFRPQTQSRHDFSGYEDEQMDSVKTASRNHQHAQEVNLYAEDEMRLSDRWSLNAGVHATLFHITGKSFLLVDPRTAVKYQANSSTSIKLAFTEMSQTIHRMGSTYLSMPTDYWVPTTKRLHPMHSYQVAAGIYSQLSKRWFASVEGYYKLTNHMLQYTNYNSLTPPAKHWDYFVMEGKGKFYGVEADVQYKDSRFDVNASYTLSWNKRKFEDFYPYWFYDKFDNRHKLNITGRMKLGSKAEVYAGWTYHTGYHTTMPTHYTIMPYTPDGYHGTSITVDGEELTLLNMDYNYEQPNNVTMPDYHRLDIGFNLHHTTKHGHERIWNISIYNAYCRLNTMYAELKTKKDGSTYLKGRGFIPIIPTASYTIRF
ncbi:MAG: TonB-dependent receptor [Prevotella sp.]|nr:TonB-dependent receptor [Prevotella sp.]